ncbi:MAG: glycosyltransferase family 9 protein [Parabacteroides sp.]|nr:glycosyltransferase family 9 protein [Parabacteroides sp.]
MKLLVIRFSAFGDIAMTVPVIDTLARQYPQLEITVLTRQFVRPLFERMPSNVNFRGVDLNSYKGLGGLWRLFFELKKEGYDAVADLHDVLRGKVLRTLFSLYGAKTAYIDKGRKEKRSIIKENKLPIKNLHTSFSRYEAVFAKLGFPVKSVFSSIYGKGRSDFSLFKDFVETVPQDKFWIGIAPFAAHKGKILPLKTTEDLISRLSQRGDCHLFLFGGGEYEISQLESWASSYSNVTSLAGKLKLNQELALMNHLSVMVSMDSANMHLASLVAVPVISVWGATHPCMGFMGWNQDVNNAVQVDLPCRPCSVFGNKPCRRGDYACLTGIQVEEIIRKIDGIIIKRSENL